MTRIGEFDGLPVPVRGQGMDKMNEMDRIGDGMMGEEDCRLQVGKWAGRDWRLAIRDCRFGSTRGGEEGSKVGMGIYPFW